MSGASPGYTRWMLSVSVFGAGQAVPGVLDHETSIPVPWPPTSAAWDMFADVVAHRIRRDLPDAGRVMLTAVTPIAGAP